MESIPHASGIYQILCVPTGKVYIGSATSLRNRWSQHRSQLNAQQHGNRYLQNAWNKYGAVAFAFRVLQVCERSDLITFEQFWIDTFVTYRRSNGFNIRPIANSNRGLVLSDETRKKMAAAQTGRKHGPLTAEHRARLAESARRQFASPEARQRLSEQGKRQFDSADARALMSEHTRHRMQDPDQRARLVAVNTGKKQTLETRTKRSVALKGHTVSTETRRNISAAKAYAWIVTDPEENKYVVTNLNQFCRDHGLQHSHMCAVARGKYRHHKGWLCRYP